MTRILITLVAFCAAFSSLHSAEEKTNSQETLLLRQLDEERLAYQLYTELGTVYPGLRQFQNIPKAEKRHFTALSDYAKSVYPEIETGSLTGDFLFPETKALYEKLLTEGKEGSRSALNVGVQVEELDIRDLDNALAGTPEEPLRQIYETLRAGSERHLSAFNRGLGQGSGQGAKNKGKGQGCSGGCGQSGGTQKGCRQPLPG